MESGAEKWGVLFSEVWDDEGLKAELFSKPKEVMERYGLKSKEDTEYVVVENTTGQCYIVIPQSPEAEMSEERVGAGTITNSCQCQCQCIPPTPCCRCQSGPNQW